MAKELKILSDGFLDKAWLALCAVDENSSRDEYVEAVDEVSDMFNELDAERFPLEVDGEVVEEGDE
jgi:hypothetical protein